MRRFDLPPIDGRYWVAIALASVFGANLGDFASHVLHLGHVRGLPILAVLFALVLWAERRGRGASTGWSGTGWYWAAIVLLRTAATNLGDLATHDLHVPVGWVAAALEALMVLFCLPRALRGADSALGGAAPRGMALGAGRNAPRRPAADGWYWATMLAAGTLGTALGDYVADGLGLGTGMGTVVLGAVLLVVLACGLPFGWAGAAYWIAVVAVRCAGTTAGDFLIGRGGLALGLPVGTACSGVAFVALLLGWRPRAAVGRETVLS